MNSILRLPASLFSCCVCVVNVRRRALLLVLLCKCGTLHAKEVTELLRKQHITQREKREAEQKQRLLQKTSYVHTLLKETILQEQVVEFLRLHLNPLQPLDDLQLPDSQIINEVMNHCHY